VTIPDAVRTTVLERLRRLDPAARAVLMRASVVGRRFDLELLTLIARRPESRVRAALDGAARLQLIVADATHPSRFAFRHALTRDIVYAEFVAARARPLHRRIVVAMEKSVRSSDVSLEDLAYHAWAALDAKRGLRYNEQAGDVAAALHAPADARAHYARARSLTAAGSRAYDRLCEKLRALDGP
jgi:predicted ATPase